MTAIVVAAAVAAAILLPVGIFVLARNTAPMSVRTPNILSERVKDDIYVAHTKKAYNALNNHYSKYGTMNESGYRIQQANLISKWYNARLKAQEGIQTRRLMLNQTIKNHKNLIKARADVTRVKEEQEGVRELHSLGPKRITLKDSPATQTRRKAAERLASKRPARTLASIKKSANNENNENNENNNKN